LYKLNLLRDILALWLNAFGLCLRHASNSSFLDRRLASVTEPPKRYVGAWIGRQPELFPSLDEQLDPLTVKLERLIIILDTLGLEAYVAPPCRGRGRNVSTTLIQPGSEFKLCLVALVQAVLGMGRLAIGASPIFQDPDDRRAWVPH